MLRRIPRIPVNLGLVYYHPEAVIASGLRGFGASLTGEVVQPDSLE